MLNKTAKSFIWAAISGSSLLVFYILVLGLLNSFSHAVEQFRLLWHWLSLLLVGFSAQAGLYAYVRYEIKERKTKAAANKELAASAGISTTSMVACCAHHLVDVLPILGLSAAFLFLAEYQVFFILLGVLSNLAGALYLLEIIKKHSLFQPAGILNKIAGLDLKTMRNGSLAISVVILLVSFFAIRNNNSQESMTALIPEMPSVSELPAAKQEQALIEQGQGAVKQETVLLSPKNNQAGGLSVDVSPKDFSFGRPVQFQVSFNTHQGDLDFDLIEKAVLFDSQNNSYQPIEWQGGRGGHHLTGLLVFPVIQETSNIKLIISDIYNIKERQFLWDL